MLAWRGIEPPADYTPVVRPSAIDDWKAPWPEEPAPAAAAALPRKWVVMGWDGASWDIILPMIEAGRLPHLAALMRGGTYGRLLTFKPTQSAVVWTTIATGVSPTRHGILGFSKPRTGVGAVVERALGRKPKRTELFSNADRRVRSVWNVASENGRTVMVVGYHNTFPVEKVSGLMVSNYLVRQSVVDFIPGARHEESVARHLVSPPQALPAVAALGQRLQDVTWQELARFSSVEPGRDRTPFERMKRTPKGDLRWEYLLKAYAYDAFHGRVAVTLRPQYRPDLLMLHFQSTDWAAHYFLYYHAPERYAVFNRFKMFQRKLDGSIPLYRGTVTSFYEFADEWLGKLLDGNDEPTGVMVVSDHALEPGHNPAEPGEHNEAPPGVLIVSGPGIKRGHRLDGATVYDILPTLLAGAGLPVARDLDGHVLDDVFVPGALAGDRLRLVATFESGARYVPQVEMGDDLHGEVERELRGLGYIQ